MMNDDRLHQTNFYLPTGWHRKIRFILLLETREAVDQQRPLYVASRLPVRTVDGVVEKSGGHYLCATPFSGFREIELTHKSSAATISRFAIKVKA